MMKQSSNSLPYMMIIIFAVFCICMPSIKSEALDDNGNTNAIPSSNDGETYESDSSDSPTANENICGNCGKSFPLTETACPECGWPVTGISLYPEAEEPGFEILEINTRSVEVIFTGVIVLDGGNMENPDGKHWRMQMKWGNSDKIESIPLNSVFHGYLFSKVEAVKTADDQKNWRLTLEGSDGKIINLKPDSAVTLNEDYIRINSDRNNDEINALELYEGNTFESNGKIYKIHDITGQRVLINDIAGFAFIVKMSR